MRINGLISFMLIALCAVPAHAQDSRSYRGLIPLPVELHTTDGARLDIGQYDTEVKIHENRSTLTFLQSGVEKAPADGKLLEGYSAALSASIPLVGTSYMRSSADPVAKAQDRQFSKTGRAQYEEEARDWKATMRVYKSRDGQGVYFEFQEKRGKGEWLTIEFRLLP